jgi:hypothetical protein
VIDERTLPDRLDAAVAGVSPDLHRLAAGAEREGRRLRRRRRVAALATTCALTAAVVTGVGWLSSETVRGTAPAPDPVATPTPAATLGADVPQPATGRATAAALAELLQRARPGTASDFAGDHTRPGALARGQQLVTVGIVRWTPPGADGSVPVRVEVQDGWGRGHASTFRCADPARVDCTVERVDGRVVVSYELHTGDAVDRYVDVWSRDRGLRVQVATSNARGIGTDPTVVLDEPPLTVAELRAVALDPVWGPTIPQRHVAAGQELPSYDDGVTR